MYLREHPSSRNYPTISERSQIELRKPARWDEEAPFCCFCHQRRPIEEPSSYLSDRFSKYFVNKARDRSVVLSYQKVGFTLATTFGRRCLCPLRPVNQQYSQQDRAKARNEDDREVFC